MKKSNVLLLLLFSLTSCQKDPELARQTSALEAFDKVELKAGFEVYLEEGIGYSVEVLGDEKMIGQVEITVQDSVLRIDNLWNAKWVTPGKNNIKIYIKAPQLAQVKATEGCYIQTLNPITSSEFGLLMAGKVCEANLELNCEIFYYWNDFPTGGKLTLSGQAEWLKIWNCAIMSVDAQNLLARDAKVKNSSKGNCLVRVSNSLEYSITGTGDIEVFGDPQEIVLQGDSSLGRLIKH